MNSIFFILVVSALLISPTDAFAYIDPGGGSTLMSVIIGLFVAIAVALKTYWYKLKRFFLNGGRQQKEKSD